MQALIAYQTGGDVGEEINKARLRKLNTDATRAELELAKERGEVALISEFERAVSEVRSHPAERPQRCPACGAAAAARNERDRLEAEAARRIDPGAENCRRNRTRPDR
ncbi:hypothetical protein [Burkholderia sp. Bp9031]|uniref:hypothetical protein n=1 Tax=Burkholderia sp. Bp9031 TaxID=2184566 RepID=UPI000A52974C|nr:MULTISPECIES: hypothetical protein [Burkholderia]